jgi:hypothetical protein
MLNDHSEAGIDPRRVSMTQDNDMQYWCMALECTEDLMREAVMAVGHAPDEVRLYLPGRQPQRDRRAL